MDKISTFMGVFVIIVNGTRGTVKHLLKTRSKLSFAYQSESTNLLQCKIKMDKISTFMGVFVIIVNGAHDTVKLLLKIRSK